MAPKHTHAVPIFILSDNVEDGYNTAHFYLKEEIELLYNKYNNTDEPDTSKQIRDSLTREETN